MDYILVEHFDRNMKSVNSENLFCAHYGFNQR